MCSAFVVAVARQNPPFLLLRRGHLGTTQHAASFFASSFLSLLWAPLRSAAVRGRPYRHADGQYRALQVPASAPCRCEICDLAAASTSTITASPLGAMSRRLDAPGAMAQTIVFACACASQLGLAFRGVKRRASLQFIFGNALAVVASASALQLQLPSEHDLSHSDGRREYPNLFVESTGWINEHEAN